MVEVGDEVRAAGPVPDLVLVMEGGVLTGIYGPENVKTVELLTNVLDCDGPYQEDGQDYRARPVGPYTSVFVVDHLGTDGLVTDAARGIPFNPFIHDEEETT